MQTISITVVILVLLIYLFLGEHKSKIKKLRKWNKEHYGKKPEKLNYDLEKIGCYWKEYEESIPDDEKIDDITWNDLEMDHIFCRINNCNSFAGEQLLYHRLHCLAKNSSILELLESKISFFARNEPEREEIQLLLSGLGKEEGSYLLAMIMNNLEAFRIPGIWAYRILQILLVLSLLPAIVLQNPACLFATAGIFFINLLIYAINKSKYEVILDTLNSVIGLVKAGIQITDHKKFLYEKEFQDIKKEVNFFRKLSHMIGRIKRSRQISLSGSLEALIYDYAVGATLWDFVRYDKIIKILKVSRKEFMELYKRIGEIDMAISIASFRESMPLYCTPVFCEEHALQTEDIYHPFLDHPVCNTVNLNRSCIITGSNASGKSTFIKAVAVNCILAQSIHTCMAKKITLPYSRIITSMAVRDDLMAGESYYIKEIKYLKRIIESLNKERFVICAIDEILRGTNTEERIAASAAILKYFNKWGCIAIVASHDTELTVRLNDIYSNFHFREKILDNDIVFEYKIYKGVADTKNAIKLLEFMKFPREILEDAGNNR